MKTKKKSIFPFGVYFPKWEKGRGLKGFERTNKFGKSKILINGLLLTCIGLSISSGFVDIVCYSGLSKSYFHVGTLLFAAAILYTIMSIFLTTGKFWCGMKIGMLKELRTQLQVAGFAWAKNITKALIPWQVAHKLLIGISLLTAMSMSVNSIGAGIRTMQQNISNMTTDTVQLIELNESVNSGVKDKREAAKSNITGNINARNDAKSEVERYFDRLVKYQEEYYTIPEEDTAARQKIIDKIVKEIPGTTTRNALYFNKADLQRSIQRTATSNEVDDSSKIYEEAVAYDRSQIEDTIKAISDKEYRLPDGKLIEFLNEDGTTINVQLAISRLQNGITQWQNDTGDVGESSKVFTLLATYIKADEKAGGMGAAEIMMMIFIFVSGVIQEFLIALCTPSATIDRETLQTVSRYLMFKDKFERENFLLDVYDTYVGLGVFNREVYDFKCAKCYATMDESREEQHIRLGLKKKEKPTPVVVEEKTTRSVPQYSKLVEDRIKEIKEL